MTVFPQRNCKVGEGIDNSITCINGNGNDFVFKAMLLYGFYSSEAWHHNKCERIMGV